jgi:hypothetical protein
VKVAVVGASPKEDRFSNKAMAELLKFGHEVAPVNPAYKEIDGLPVVPELGMLLPGSIDTVTVYLGPDRSEALRDDLVALRPRRVIFNPGAENPDLAETLRSAGIETVEACTLVMLRTGQF